MRVKSWLRVSFQSYQNSFLDSFRLLHNIAIPEPNHFIPLRLQALSTLVVIVFLNLVMATIDLDYQPSLFADKVRKVVPNWNLSAEFVAISWRFRRMFHILFSASVESFLSRRALDVLSGAALRISTLTLTLSLKGEGILEAFHSHSHPLPQGRGDSGGVSLSLSPSPGGRGDSGGVSLSLLPWPFPWEREPSRHSTRAVRPVPLPRHVAVLQVPRGGVPVAVLRLAESAAA